MKLNLQDAIDGKNDHELNLALCEWLGWVFVRLSSYRDKRPVYRGPTSESLTTELPNYITAPESLGLAHEVEKKLTSQQLWCYRIHLATQFADHPDDGFVKAIHATARQRVVKPEIFEP